MTILVPISDSEFQAFVEASIPAYAQRKVASGEWPQVDALDRAIRLFGDLLPQGRHTPDNHVFTIQDPASVAVGVIWIAARDRGGERIAYVYEVMVKREHQRKGHARAAFIALEGELRALGMSGIELHVFGDNAAARALYAKLGFQATSIIMYKPLAGPAAA